MEQYAYPQNKLMVATLLLLVTGILISCQQGIDKNNKALATPDIQSSSKLTPSPESILHGPSLAQRHLNDGLQQEIVSVGVVSASEEPVGLQMPAFIEAEVAGRGLKKIVLLAGRLEEDGSRRLFLFDEQSSDPLPVEGETWPDGIHEIVQVWYSEGDYLADDAHGDFILLQESNLGGDIREVEGRYRPADQDEYYDATLFVDIGISSSTGLLETATGTVISPQPGDEFQVKDVYLLEDQDLAHSPGASLIFDQNGQLSYGKRPLPGGSYILGLLSETASGRSVADFRELTVGNENLRPGLRAYYDPVKHFQFLYPEYLMEITKDGERLTTQNISGTIKLSVSHYPESYQKPIADLKADVLRTFGDVQILYEDTAPLGSTGALWTAYGYEAASGSHTGVFLVFYQDDLAYVVDIDSQGEEKARMLEAIKILSESWVTRPGISGRFAGNWRPASVNGLELWAPTEYQYVELTNEWHKFYREDESNFFALRSEPAAGGRILDKMRHWLEISARDVEEFSYSDFYTVDLAGISWVRLDLMYQLGDGTEIAGSIMASRMEDELLFTWAEAPAQLFDVFEREQFLLTLATVRREN